VSRPRLLRLARRGTARVLTLVSLPLMLLAIGAVWLIERVDDRRPPTA
jgi:hypothetical protein